MDVHFSLPRPEDTNARCDKDKNQVGHVVLNFFRFLLLTSVQGSIVVAVRGQRFINEMDLGRMAEGFGEIRSVRQAKEPE